MTIISFNNEEVNVNATTRAELADNVRICDAAMQNATSDADYEKAMFARVEWNDKLVAELQRCKEIERVAKVLGDGVEVVKVDRVFETSLDYFNSAPAVALREAFQLNTKIAVVREGFVKGFQVGDRIYHFSKYDGITFLQEFTAFSSMDSAGWDRVSFVDGLNIIIRSKGSNIAKTKRNRQILGEQGAFLTSVYTSFNK